MGRPLGKAFHGVMCNERDNALGGVWVKRKYGALLGRYEIRDTMQARIEKADLT
jgi:hypothetical protein